MSAHSIPAVLRPAGLHCFLCASRHDRRGSSGFDAIEQSEGIRDAEALADRILRDTLPLAETSEKRDLESIERLFQLTLNRQPTAEEQTLAAELLQRERARFSANDQDRGVRFSFVSLCRAMLNLNEFVYVDRGHPTNPGLNAAEFCCCNAEEIATKSDRQGASTGFVKACISRCLLSLFVSGNLDSSQ
jgi:hypothetical protein